MLTSTRRKNIRNVDLYDFIYILFYFTNVYVFIADPQPPCGSCSNIYSIMYSVLGNWNADLALLSGSDITIRYVLFYFC